LGTNLLLTPVDVGPFHACSIVMARRPEPLIEGAAPLVVADDGALYDLPEMLVHERRLRGLTPHAPRGAPRAASESRTARASPEGLRQRGHGQAIGTRKPIALHEEVARAHRSIAPSCAYDLPWFRGP
jgi:hypothetical protein